MKKSKIDFFWPSFSDLMTSLFFIMLVLYFFTYVQLKKKNIALERQLKLIKTVEANLAPMKKDTGLFQYEEKYNRFKLAFNVKFNQDGYRIERDYELVNPVETRRKIEEAGRKLKTVIDSLLQQKLRDTSLNKLSYLVIIAGYASQDNNPDRLRHNYDLSYNRAFNLWQFWKSKMIDLEGGEYKDLVDLHIAGNGWGGVGRLSKQQETDNQRFLIEIFPKIGDFK